MEGQSQVMQRMRSQVILFLTLMLFWGMLDSSLSNQSLLVGAFISLIITVLYREGLSFFTEFRATPRAFFAGICYYGYFFKELVKSNIRLATIILSPSLPIEPGIVKVRTKLKSKMGRLMLANSISLTPGTLTVELDGNWIYVHWVRIESSDIDTATAKIVEGFESYLEVMYG